ncbi:hypothetical protein V1503_19050 [Bacillus sp. SCS-151]|uniref:hypothetical protein n=1 Tax=Nanhaiella sioensis TaxID=3115293 RepID=UPI0039784F6B
MENKIDYLVNKGMSKKQLEKANDHLINEIHNKFMNPYIYDKQEYPVTITYLKNHMDRYGLKEVKHLMLYYYNNNRMNDWTKTAKFIKKEEQKQLLNK